MSEPHGYTREGETVVLRMTRKDFSWLMKLLGYVTAKNDFGYDARALANRLILSADYGTNAHVRVIEDSP